ncbi:MAG TPA: phosphoribosylamine--glycine ligase [Gammaproteobacteria bacterium]|nr:phosphoribosylamine--glycine ligase [Gammaproteobacteria bacterium]
MKVLVIGSGGREHGLAWKIAQSSLVEQVYVAPGNAGTASEPGVENVSIDAMDFDGLLEFVQMNEVGLTVVGPEDPLVGGLVDRFKLAGSTCFGPDQWSAQLEGSKSFTKNFLKKYEIPTGDCEVFEESEAAIAYLSERSPPFVIKADGLAAGKGVVIAQDLDEAIDAVRGMLSGNLLGDAGSRIVIEEFLEGEEVSFIVLADGNNFLPFASSQDHKAAFDGDNGPNTGGMGAYSPAPVITPEIHDRIVERIIRPTISGMQHEKHPYTGFLYAGLIIDKEGNPSVIEFNCRFGDPETQPVMMRLNSDLVELILAAIDGNLHQKTIEFAQESSLCVVIASGGYPGSYKKGMEIEGLQSVSGAKVFHAGTRMENGRVVTSGGRVLGVTALGDDISSAQEKAYLALSGIRFKKLQFRRDIGHRAIAREKVGD